MTIGKNTPADDIAGWTNDPFFYKHLNLEIGRTFLWRVNLRNEFQIANGSIDRNRDYEYISWLPGYQQAEHVILIDTESFLPDIWPKDPRVHIFDSTLISDHHRYHGQFTPYWFWFDWTRDVEQRKNFRDRLTGYETKIYQKDINKFDCLLGKRKPWRDKIYHNLKSRPALSSIVVNYTGHDQSWMGGTDIEDGDLSAYQLPVFLHAGNATADILIPYHDRQTANLACFVTYKIYNRSWYTMLIETHPDRVFFTEKTAKALLGRRVFVMFGASGSLAALKAIGFRTFSSIMDEGYDAITDHDTRHEAAIKAASWLAQQDPVEVYRAAEDIIAHNQRMMLETDWAQSLKDTIRRICQ